MHLTDDLRRSSASKLLAFRTPSPEIRGAESPLSLSADPEQVAHDVAMLRRPKVLETQALPQMAERDGLAHDARNLLTSLELLSGLLAEPGILAKEHEHFAGDLKALTGPLASIVERMASVPEHPSDSNFAGGSVPIFKREPLRSPLASVSGSAHAKGWIDQQNGQQADAGVLVKSCERLLGAIAGPNVKLHISSERGVGELAMSGEALTRVLINLVKNATEAMPGGGRVAITVRKAISAQPSVLLSIEDTGRGIPAHALGQIFQAGFSSKKPGRAWPAAMHHGLGLTIVRELVEAAGGSVRVVSALRKGTTFEIKVPCRRG